MILWICTGLIVFDEARFYTNLELLGIGGSILLSCAGIKCLTMKTKMLEAARIADKKEENKSKVPNDED